MLRFMRRHQRSFIVKGVFVILILVFVGWGVGTFDPAQQTAAVAVVNGVTISVAELTQAQQALLRRYQELYGQAYSPELVRQLDLQGRALDELITSTLLLGEAERLGLRVSDEEVAQEIKRTFSSDGRFDKGVYLRFLRLSQLDDEQFVERQRKALLTRRLEDLITDGAHVSDEELRDRYLIENQQVRLRYVTVRAAADDETAVSEEEVRAHYDANPERYRLPERVSFSYVAYRPAEYEDDVTLGDAEISEYYTQRLGDRFTDPEQVQLRQIVIDVPAGAEETQRAELRSRARELATRAKEGDFAALARDHSDDQATAAQGGEVGWVERSALSPELADAAFALAEGAASEPVELPNAIYILKVEGARGPRPRPLDEVRDAIEAALRKEGGRRLARAAAAEDASRIAAGRSLEDVAAARGLGVERSEPQAGDTFDPTLGPTTEMVGAAHRLREGETSDVIETAQGFFLVRPAETIPPSAPPFEEVRSRVEADLRAERARQAAVEKATELLGRTRESGDLAAVATEAGLTVQETAPFGRSGSVIPGLGTVDGLKADAFTLSRESPVAPRVYATGEGNQIVAVLGEQIPADLAKLEQGRDTVRNGYLQRKKQALFNSFVAELKRNADIDVRAQLLPQT
jgi:peptidyl-prolyl cis-trans isomerase D